VDASNLYVVIWTTTPWTLPANLAVSFHPEFQYSAVKFGSEYYFVANGLIFQIEDAVGRKNDGEIPVSMDDIKKLKVYHPFINRESKVIFGTHVTLDAGTGIVHTAPGHGHEDYIVGLEYGLDVFCPVDEKGRFTDEYKEMKGVNVFDANDKIVDLLKDKKVLIKTDKIVHSYPHCWRCKNPLIYRATEQWFLNIDHDDLRKKGIDIVNKTEWIPSWGQARFLGMVETRPDWCLSRQRSWGVPIPSFRCEKCGENLMSAESVKLFAGISRKKGIDSWFTEPIKDLIPAGTKCKCGNDTFVKEFDILDVWFDSGVSHFAVLDTWKDHRWPADLYLEGSDQHRGWFQSSFWPALALRGRAPYNTVLTHGFMLDEEGKAMSKSLGNVKPPEEFIKEYGADILRLWVSSEDYRNDVRIGAQMMKQIADSYRRIRNTLKFIIGNLSDFTPEKAVPYAELSDLDKWLLHKLYGLSARIIEHYEKFEFHLVYRKILNFCAVELSSIYFDISKDILYVELPDSKKRRANQTVQSELLKSLSRLMAPIMSFTMEEVWRFNNNPGSIHMERYYALDDRYNNPEIEQKIEHLVDIKKDVLKELEMCRKDKAIKSSLEAEITLHVPDESAKKMLAGMGPETARFLQVAAVAIAPEKTADMHVYDNAAVSVRKTTGKKCVRCWNYFETIGVDPAHPELCRRCTDIIKAME
jgi:isoleucyl-tRNA synthetase